MYNTFEEMTSLQKVTKTLRFKLIPIGKTQDTLENIIESDYKRDKAYPIVKGLIDRAYRDLISEGLSENNIKTSDEISFVNYYNQLSKSGEDRNELDIEKEKNKLIKNLDKLVNKDKNIEHLATKNFIDVITDLYDLDKEET